jgi:hypothetical protein
MSAFAPRPCSALAGALLLFALSPSATASAPPASPTPPQKDRRRELQAGAGAAPLRGVAQNAAVLPRGGARSHPAWWAAFLLSGDTGPCEDAKP